MVVIVNGGLGDCGDSVRGVLFVSSFRHRHENLGDWDVAADAIQV